MSQTERIVYALPFVPKTVKETTDDLILRQVAGYARVSTSEEEQQNSYEAQIDYYTNYIQSHEGWAFAGMYADVDTPYGQKPRTMIAQLTKNQRTMPPLWRGILSEEFDKSGERQS